jgi:alpha-N-arabinofuranosidase
VYLVNNRAPAGGSQYSGHRAIWIQEYDPAQKQMVGESTQLVNGGVDIAQKPVWIEGPHVYKIDGRYYLNMAEGGTAHDHRQVIFRSDAVRGPFVPGPVNPILTQRHLDPNRPFPIMAAGHADYVQTPAGEWWAIFLASRPYAEDYFNTGRETFLLPLRWENGWPSFVGGLEPIGYALPRPKLPPQPKPAIPTSGNFTVRDEFDGHELAPYWQMVRTPRERWYELSGGALALRARPADIARREQPSFVWRRQQHTSATFTTYYGTERGRWTPVLESADGKILSTRVAGGFGGNFTGVVVGMYAHSAP